MLAAAIAIAVAVGAIGLVPGITPTRADNVQGAIYTTLPDGTSVNANQYESKDDVYLQGGPTNAPQCSSNGLTDGLYYFQVTTPDGEVLSSDAVADREIQVVNGVLAGVGGTGTHLEATATSPCGSLGVQLMPYDNTTNSGGEYSVNIYPAECVDAALTDEQLTQTDPRIDLASLGCPTKNDNFKVESAPELTVTKTAEASITETCTWDITKDVDQTRIDIAEGGEATFNYTVSVTHECNATARTVSGVITVVNSGTADATGVAVTDATDNGGVCTVTDGGSVDIGPGEQVELDYSCTYAAAPDPTDGTNTATATLPDGTATTGTAAILFSEAETTFINGTVTVSDSLAGELGTVSASDPSPTTFEYSQDFEGVGGTCTDIDNTATITGDEGAELGSASQTVTVCVGLDLTVEKTAEAAFTRTFAWDISKDVDQTRIDIADGGEATFNYTVSVTHDAGTDSGWVVTGTITITNPNDFEDITADVSDAIDNGGVCTVTDGTDVVVPAGESVELDYECTYATAPDPSAGTNTATATWDADEAHTPTGSASGTADVDFASVTPTVVNDTVTVSDTLGGELGTVSSSDPSPTTFEYSQDFEGVGGTCTDFDNTATILDAAGEPLGSASQTVTVCVGLDLTVEKTAEAAFTRTFTWDISKAVDQTRVTATGGTATFNYTVSVTHDEGTDSDFVVAGTITVTNPNDFEDVTVDVTDAVDNGGVCTVADGSAVVVPAGESVELDYECTFASMPDPTAGTNTATVTWDAEAAHTPSGSASGEADFDFASASPELVDETVSVSDSFAGSLGTVSSDDPSPTTFTYSRTVDIPASGCVDYDNTATFVTSDTGTTGSASQTVTVCRQVAFGKTQGFWGNKNGQALIPSGFAYTLGLAAGCHIDVTKAKTATVLPKSLNGLSIATGCGSLDAGINTNSLNVAFSQALALRLNQTVLTNGFGSNTIASLSCTDSIGSLASLPAPYALSGSSTVQQVLDTANYLIGNAAAGGVVVTQTQLGDLNALLGCMNREA